MVEWSANLNVFGITKDLCADGMPATLHLNVRRVIGQQLEFKGLNTKFSISENVLLCYLQET